MKKNVFKIALVSACFAFTIAACNSDKNAEGASDSDSLMDTQTMGTDTTGMGTDTTGMGTDTTGMGTNETGTGTGSGTTNP